MTQLFATQYLQQLFNQNPMAQDPYQALTRLLSSSNVIPQDAFQGMYGVMQGMPLVRSPEGVLHPWTEMPTEQLTQNLANNVFSGILQPGGGYPLPSGMMGGAAGANMNFMDWAGQNPAYLSGPELLQNQVRMAQQFGLPGQGALQDTLSGMLGHGYGNQLMAWQQALQSGGVGNQMMDLANRVQGGDFGPGAAPTATTPGFAMPNQVGSPGIQQPLENVLSQNLMQGNLNPEFIQAQREMVLEPAQENLMGQLNQLGGGVGGLSSGLPAEMQRRLERDFMNQMTTLGFQGQQNALDQSRMLGGQQFGQGMSNEQLMQQAMQQQAGMQQQTGLANLGLAGQYGLFGAGQGLQAAQLAGSLMQGAGGLDLGRTGQLGDIAQGMYGGGLSGYGAAASNLMNQWGTTQQLQSQPEMSLESILQGRRAQDIGALSPYLQQQNQLLNLVTGNLDRSMQWSGFQEATRQNQMNMAWNAFLTEAQERFQRETVLRQGVFAREAAEAGGGSSMGSTLPSLAAFALGSILLPGIGGAPGVGGGFNPLGFLGGLF
jgi:hypothetical protein